MYGIWKIGIPKDTLIEILEKLDADEDGFVTVGEVGTSSGDTARMLNPASRAPS